MGSLGTEEGEGMKSDRPWLVEGGGRRETGQSPLPPVPHFNQQPLQLYYFGIPSNESVRCSVVVPCRILDGALLDVVHDATRIEVREEDSMKGTEKVAVGELVGEREGVEGQRIGVLEEAGKGEVEEFGDEGDGGEVELESADLREGERTGESVILWVR